MDWTTLKELAASFPKEGEAGGLRSGWRCLEELAGKDEFYSLLTREFMIPPDAQENVEGLRRRDFLKLIGGSLALAGVSGLSGCTVKPHGKIVPYVNQPEQIIPGKPLYYATALEFCGFGRGVLVETHEGRPTKVEGNPDHPASLGATSLFEQAAILDLYNPMRSSTLLREGEPGSWQECMGELQRALEKLPAGGAGLHILTGRMTSPAFGGQWAEVLDRYPRARWHQYEPLHGDNAFRATTAAFGVPVEPHYRFDLAKAIVSFGADFLFGMPGSVRYARDLMKGRFPRSSEAVGHLYVLESVPSVTGCYADERVPLAPGEIMEYGAALAEELGVLPMREGAADRASGKARLWAKRVAADLVANKPNIVIAGDDQPAELHQLVYLMNHALEATGGKHDRGVSYARPLSLQPVDNTKSIMELAAAIGEGSVQILLMLGGDWARTSPADLGFAAALGSVPFSLHNGLYVNETALAARWHIPQAHPFEAWGDTRAFDGTTTIMQPLVEPLFGGRSMHEVLDCVARFPGRSSFAIVHGHWVGSGRIAEEAWRRALHDGVLKESPGVEEVALPEQSAVSGINHTPQKTSNREELELLFVPDASLWDGRYSQNAWLQELPRPITKLSWENAFLVSPATALRAGVEEGGELRVTAKDGGVLQGVAMVQPGVAEGVLVLALGGGAWPKQAEGGFASEVRKGFTRQLAVETLGINGYPLRTSGAPWRVAVTIEKGSGKRKIATTQRHHSMEGRDLLRVGSREELKKHSQGRDGKSPPTLYNLTQTMSDQYAWAMSIDLSRCIACNACMVACQAENNIPPVGREEVLRGREMHWIRLDSYYFGEKDDPFIANQPVACMHCETAPCEVVCPVAATVHDHEGLNVQVYNRCIGTRYCSNNCPYKVRRFNFFRYAEEVAKEPLQLMANPDVTIRARGVMEKCTYCVQRISEARIHASLEKRLIRDGEVVPACVQVCPTETIVFGNLKDPNSRIVKWKEHPLNYSMLSEQGTNPRTSYLPRVVNPTRAEAQSGQ